MPQRLSKDIDRAWAESFAHAISQPVLPPGKGWMTLPQICKKFNLGTSYMRVAIKKLMKDGVLERFVGQQSNGRRVFRAIYYRPKGLKNAV